MSPEIRRLAFSAEEYSHRLSRVHAAMAEQELDALLIHHRAHICYLTGLEN